MCKAKTINLFFFFWLLFILSCVDTSGYDYLASLASEDYDLTDRRTRRQSTANLRDTSDPCKDSRSCIRTCDEIYLRASALNECYSKRENTVKRIARVFDDLINPKKLSDLNNIDEDDFSDYLNISITSFLDVVDPIDKDEDGDRRQNNDDWEDLYAYDSDNARLALEWIANDEDIAQTLQRKDKRDEIFTELFIRAGHDLVKSRSTSSRPECLRSGLGSWSDDHLRFALGFSDNAYDRVSFLTYANGQRNDSAYEAVEFLNRDLCPKQVCALPFLCLTKVYEGNNYIADDLSRNMGGSITSIISGLAGLKTRLAFFDSTDDSDLTVLEGSFSALTSASLDNLQTALETAIDNLQAAADAVIADLGGSNHTLSTDFLDNSTGFDPNMNASADGLVQMIEEFETALSAFHTAVVACDNTTGLYCGDSSSTDTNTSVYRSAYGHITNRSTGSLTALNSLVSQTKNAIDDLNSAIAGLTGISDSVYLGVIFGLVRLNEVFDVCELAVDSSQSGCSL